MINVSNYAEIINALYSKLTNAVLCSDVVVRRTKSSFFKQWWDSALDVLKNNSIENYNLWQSVGKPSSGEIFQKMKQSKLEYKQSIIKHKKESEMKFGEELYDNFLNKDLNGFWKSWKSKFSKKESHAKMIEGCNDSSEIVQVFI